MKKLIIIIGVLLIGSVAAAITVGTVEWKKIDNDTFQKVETIVQEQYSKSALEAEKSQLQEIQALTKPAFERSYLIYHQIYNTGEGDSHTELTTERITEIDAILVEINKLK